MPPTGRSPHPPFTVLLVDDDPTLLACAQERLEDLGCRVTVAHEGREAIEAVRHAPDDYDLVLTDYTMPGLNGVETLAAIRSIHPDQRAILSSGSSEWDCLHGQRMEHCVFLGKPYRAEDLGTAIARVMEEGDPGR